MAKRDVSVICTVYNETASINRLLESLTSQTTSPAEIVIVDGGSSDGTPDKIKAFADAHSETTINLIVQPGYNISQGRNAAINAATCPIIAATDAGVRLPPDWLEHLTNPFFHDSENLSPLTDQSYIDIGQAEAEQKVSGQVVATQNIGQISVVAGFFQTDPDPHAPFEIAMGATVLPAEEDIKPEKFLPSSRSIAFTKEAWRQAGGYPEWLDYCEDLIFDLNLKKLGYSFYWQPKAIAYFKPRSTLRAFFIQYYRYARGDGKADLFLKRHLLRYFIYLGFAPLAITLIRKYSWLAVPFLICAEGYVGKAHRRLIKLPTFQELHLPQKLMAMLYVPVIRLTGDIAKMLGYPVGVWWRLKQ